MKNSVKAWLISLMAVGCIACLAACKKPSQDGAPADSTARTEYFLLSDKSLSLTVGDGHTLSVSYDVAEDGEVQYVSSAPSVVSVDGQGNLTALQTGEALITARLGNFTATCAVDVSLGDCVPYAEFSAVYGDGVVISSQETADLTVSVSFNGKAFDFTPVYTVADPEIGRVENGEFIPLALGETTVTVGGEWNSVTLLPITVSVEVISSVEITLQEKGASQDVKDVHLYTYNSFAGQSLKTQFEAQASVVENGVPQSAEKVSVSVEDNGVIAFDEASGTVTAIAPGTAQLYVSYEAADGRAYNKQFPVTVHKPMGVYAKTVTVDASKGLLPVDEIFAEFAVEDRTITAADGNFTVEDGKVFGFTVDNEKSQQVTVYNRYVGYTVTVVPYTRIFTSAEELAMFSMQDYETAYKGYYILGNDIDATGYTHADHIRYAGNGYKAYTNIGLLGTFDGKGHTVDGITIGRSGLFGMVGKGAVIKNVGFTNVKFSGLNEGNYALACYICSASISNVYIEASALSKTGWNNALVANNITVDCTVENCIFRLDEAYSKTASYGSFTAISMEREKLSGASSAFLKNCYVISPTPMTKDNNNYICDVGDAAYVYPNVKRYETVAAMQADTANDYTSFASEFWQLSTGIPVWKK